MPGANARAAAQQTQRLSAALSWGLVAIAAERAVRCERSADGPIQQEVRAEREGQHGEHDEPFAGPEEDRGQQYAWKQEELHAGIDPDQFVARQSGWEHSDNQDGHFGGRGGRMIVAGRR
jgi:hypothetical protein